MPWRMAVRRARGLRLRRPSHQDGRELSVSIDAANNCSLEDKPVECTQVAEVIKRAYPTSKPRVDICLDKEARYEAAVEVMNSVSAAGFTVGSFDCGTHRRLSHAALRRAVPRHQRRQGRSASPWPTCARCSEGAAATPTSHPAEQRQRGVHRRAGAAGEHAERIRAAVAKQARRRRHGRSSSPAGHRGIITGNALAKIATDPSRDCWWP